MTSDSQLPEAIQSGLTNHLGRVNLYLLRNGASVDQREEVRQALEGQILDMLRARCKDQPPTEDDLMVVLESLDPPESYTLDTPSTGRMLTILLRRFWIGYVWKLAVNDHGRRRFHWGLIAIMFVQINLLFLAVLIGMGWLLTSRPFHLVAGFGVVMLIAMNIGIGIGLYRHLGRSPITDLPMADKCK